MGFTDGVPIVFAQPLHGIAVETRMLVSEREVCAGAELIGNAMLPQEEA